MVFAQKNIYFTTFTVENWISVFQDFPETIETILQSMRYLADNKYVRFYAFVIMKDHIHFLWKINSNNSHEEIIIMFKKYTGKNIIHYLNEINPTYTDFFNSERKDRHHKFWKLKSQSTHIKHLNIFIQKINYIHNNPCKGQYKTVQTPEDYLYSSAKSYSNQERNFSFLDIYDI